MTSDEDLREFQERLHRMRSALERKRILPGEFIAEVIGDLLVVRTADLEACIAELRSQELAEVNKCFDATVRTGSFDPSPTKYMSPVDDFETVKKTLIERYSAIDKVLAGKAHPNC